MVTSQFSSSFLKNLREDNFLSNDKINNIYVAEAHQARDVSARSVYCREGMADEEKQTFRSQYETLISLIVQWCQDKGVLAPPVHNDIRRTTPLRCFV